MTEEETELDLKESVSIRTDRSLGIVPYALRKPFLAPSGIFSIFYLEYVFKIGSS